MQSDPVSPPPITTPCLPSARIGSPSPRARPAPANHPRLLAFGEDRLDIALRLSGDAAVLLRQEIHGEVNAVKLAARDGEVARVFGAAGEQKSIIIAFQLLHAHVAPDMHVAMEDDAFGFHL